MIVLVTLLIGVIVDVFVFWKYRSLVDKIARKFF